MTDGTSTGAAKAPSIGPGAIATPGTAGGPGFVLSSTNWIAIQTYVMDGLGLPTTDDKFKDWMGKGAPSDLSHFKPLMDCFTQIQGQCKKWQDDVYPASVSLASDVYDYGQHKAPALFPKINEQADILSKNSSDADAQAKLKAILQALTKDAQTRADNATKVKTQIKKFADDTLQSKATLSGTPDKPGGLVKSYMDEYGQRSTEVIEVTKQIAEQKQILQQETDNYNHDVVVAATTPTYAWVWLIGTIPAIVVAGVYTARALEALDKVNAAKKKINDFEATLAADALLMIGLTNAETGMSRILNDLNAALPIIELIEGVWGGIADDLQNLVNLIDSDITKALPIIMSIGVDEALSSWHDVAVHADAYRTNAYVVTK
jgi:hypothetical protein